jgi:UDP-2,3-diacylglucosamine pyrophosphatase LpxH
MKLVRLFSLLLLVISNVALAKDWSFIVMSDIHIYASGTIPSKFKNMVKHIVDKKPEIVFITGDYTSGNLGDTYSLEHIQMWYQQLDTALAPIYDAGIMVIPTVGNHDFYLEHHKTAYTQWATKTLLKYNSVLNFEVKNSLFFNFKYKGQEFFIMKFWTFLFDNEQKSWFDKAAVTKPEYYRFAFGHVPLKSIRGRTTQSFYKSALESFIKGNVEIYFSGHEHMHWDEFLPSENSNSELRQLTVGTTSGTYNHPIRSQARELHCIEETTCAAPATGRRFLIESRSGKPGYQVNRQNFVEVIFKDNLSYKINSYSIDNEKRLIDFYLD